MFVTPAYAQAGGESILASPIVPLIFVMIIFYFLLWRPQSQQRKQHEAKLEAIRRNDTIVTNGGLVGKVIKVHDDEIEVEIAKDVKVKVVRNLIADVRVKGEATASK